MRRRFSSQFLGMNSTLVYEGNFGYLVDPGVFPRETDRILNFIQDNRIENIVILFTHTHGDHISGWHAFQHFPSYAHENVNLKNETVRQNDVKYLKGMWRKQMVPGFDNLIFPDNLQYLADGERLPIPPFSLVFYSAPGHSTDMSVVIIPEEKVLFSGDMLILSNVPFIQHSTHQYWHSLKKVKKLVNEYDIQCLIPGHGKTAKSKSEILVRIQNEQLYLQKLILEGMALFNKGDEYAVIKSKLLSMTDAFRNLHAHQTNVQTLLREIEIWADDVGSDLSL